MAKKKGNKKYVPKKATGAQQLAASRITDVAKYNAKSIAEGLDTSLNMFDDADRRAEAEAANQRTRNDKQSSNDRFSQMRKLQSSAKGLLSSAGNAIAGSNLGALSGMLQSRNDSDSSEVFGTLTQNQGMVNSELTKTKSDNLSAREAAINEATLSVKNLEAGLAADLASTAEALYKAPGKKVAAVKGRKRTKTKPAVKARPAVGGSYLGSNEVAGRRGARTFAVDPIPSGYYSQVPTTYYDRL